MKHITGIKAWERKENHGFFLDFQNPTISITSEVECSGAKTRARTAGELFSLRHLYAVLRAVSEIKEFRSRIDSEGQVVYLDVVDMPTPTKMTNNERFFTARLPWHPNFRTFRTEAKTITNRINPDRDPYGAERTGGDDLLNVILLSATPDLYFASLTYTQEHRHDSNYPLMNAGKAIIRGDVLVMSIAITIHRGFIDRHHLPLFYKKVEGLPK